MFSFVLKSIKNAKAPNRGARLRCIYHLIKNLPKNQYNTIKAVVPEAIICCKDINKNTRLIAFRLLEEMFYISKVRRNTTILYFYSSKRKFSKKISSKLNFVTEFFFVFGKVEEQSKEGRKGRGGGKF